MDRVLVGDAQAPYPLLTLRFRANGRTTRYRRVVVDTGASAVVLPWSVAEELGLDEVAKTAPSAPFAGFGQGSSTGRRMEVDMLLPGPTEILGVEVYFIERAQAIVGRDGLLGQRGFFQRVKLVQLTAPDLAYVLEW